jgi:BlaI family penicillinase repressor
LGVKVSDSEVQVLQVLWSAGEAITERFILDELQKESAWNQQTIKTFLKRLLDKGAVRREKREVFYYSAVLSRADFARSRTEELVRTVFGGDARSLLATMLHSDILLEEDVDELKLYWQGRKER